MEKLDLTKVPNDLKPHPIFEGMDESLKDPKRFKPIEKKLQAIIDIDHKHKTAKSYGKCLECADKREKRLKAMRDLGFKDLRQYMEWKKIMTIIINKKDFQVR